MIDWDKELYNIQRQKNELLNIHRSKENPFEWLLQKDNTLEWLLKNDIDFLDKLISLYERTLERIKSMDKEEQERILYQRRFIIELAEKIYKEA